jgi:hypothetical protein
MARTICSTVVPALITCLRLISVTILILAASTAYRCGQLAGKSIIFLFSRGIALPRRTFLKGQTTRARLE